MGKYNENNSTMEILIEMHDMIKQHPYRLSREFKYYSDYSQLLDEFSDVSYYVIREVCKKDNISNWSNMWHDFNGAIRHCNMEHIERCVMSIHKFMDSGEWKEYYTYYTGGNIEKGVNRLRKFVYDKDKHTFYPIYKDEEIQIVLDEHTKKLPDAKGYNLKYHNNVIEYYNELREWNKSIQTNI